MARPAASAGGYVPHGRGKLCRPPTQVTAKSAQAPPTWFAAARCAHVSSMWRGSSSNVPRM
eukprot:7062971-Prymnesium_polylepis.1